ncbi:MAG: efflux RND transporter periplasmic adaptor subunit [Deltaproteobacteria bacterium]|nr:efflux RND transporter periplasmic adaptor subunit [Deltaproteobacteria bacterium]
MRSELLRGALLVLISVALVACKSESQQPGAETSEDGRKVVFYRSPMDPSFISENPGKDAMGMELVPVFEGDPAADLNSIEVDGATIQRMGVRTQMVERGKLTRIVRAVGRVDLDETRVSEINMKFDGWIEKLWVAETGQFVKEGDPLFAVYSQELWASQDEYLQIVRSRPEGPHAQHLLDSARQRLLQFDVPPSFLREITKSGSPRRRVVIRAPATGYVVHKMAFEGTYVQEGSNLFTIADLDALWVLADVFESDAPWVTVGQEATLELDYLPGSMQTAKVDYVYPTLEEKTRTIKVRLILPNPAVLLKPGMFATVRIHTQPADEAVIVPNEAVIHSGERNVAFVSLGEGRFDPRELKLGVRGDDNYQVLDGLKEGEDVVVSSHFLLDSESRLKEVALKMLGGNVETPAREEAPVPTPAHEDHAE